MANLKLTSKRKKIVIGVALGAIVVLVGAFVFLKWSPFSETSKQPAPMSANEVRASSLDYVDDNDAEGGFKYYDSQIDQARDDDDKKQLLLHRAEFARRLNKPDEAIDAAKQADDISPDTATAQALAMAYEAKGDKEQAVAHYERVIDLLSGDEMESSYILMWEKKIEELQS